MSHPLYWNTLDQIYNCNWTIQKLAHLEKFKQAIIKLWPSGHPTKFIQVAGTSGKGTTCRFLEACLSTNFQCGTLTSPHLFDYRERFTINGKTISQDEIIDIWENKIRPFLINEYLLGNTDLTSYQSIYLLIALTLFEKYQIEYGIMETGLGGRYDTVSALDFQAVILTNVGNDHSHFLGTKKWQRVIDKSGICKKNIPFFTAEEDRENLKIIQDICAFYNSPLFKINNQTIAQDYFNASYNIKNSALSLEVAKYIFKKENKKFDIIQAIKKIQSVKFAGRFQKIEDQLYIDIAHNSNKIKALVDRIKIEKDLKNKKKIFILGLSGNRNPQEVFAPILEIADSIIITNTLKKGVNPEKIKQALNEILKEKIVLEVINHPKNALKKAKELLDNKSVIIATGSTFMLDQMLNPDEKTQFLNLENDWR